MDSIGTNISFMYIYYPSNPLYKPQYLCVTLKCLPCFEFAGYPRCVFISGKEIYEYFSYSRFKSILSRKQHTVDTF